jgi:predicted transcriptional regulator
MAMRKEAILTLQVDVELHDAFMAAAKASHRPASQIIRDMMRDFIAQQEANPDYVAFLQRKVDLARSQIASGDTLSDEEVEREFAEKRTAISNGRR